MAKRLSLTPEERHAREYQRALRDVSQSGLDPKGPAVLFAVDYLDGYPNPETLRRYGRALGLYFGWCADRMLDPMQAVTSTASAYEGYVRRQPTPGGTKLLATATTKTNLAVVRAFYRLACDDGILTANPFRRIRLSASPENETPAMTPEDINKVLNRIASRPMSTLVDQRDYAVIYIASRVGPRRTELGKLTWQDLNHTSRGPRARVRRKGGEMDFLVLPADVHTVLEQWRGALESALRRRVRDDEPVFPAVGPAECDIKAARRATLHPLGLQQFTNGVRGRFADAGLVGPRYATHVLRASAATIAWEAGADIGEIQLMLGHKDQATTWKYIKRIHRKSPAERWSLDVLPFPGLMSDEEEAA